MSTKSSRNAAFQTLLCVSTVVLSRPRDSGFSLRNRNERDDPPPNGDEGRCDPPDNAGGPDDPQRDQTPGAGHGTGDRP
jgi:hypothetical protein